jgi:hypothetical protein
MLEQVVFSAPGKIITARQLNMPPARFPARLPTRSPAAEVDAGAVPNYPVLDASVPADRQLILDTLESTGGNIARSAHLLGITRDKNELSHRADVTRHDQEPVARVNAGRCRFGYPWPQRRLTFTTLPQALPGDSQRRAGNLTNDAAQPQK